ncbi:MAG: acetyltransferase [Paucibacter sp.]|nr:acetyltransferase [Roseateles sp.]
MKRPNVIVVGAGGHAVVVADALLQAGRNVVGFLDSSPTQQKRELCGLPVLSEISYLAQVGCKEAEMANGIGGIGSTLHRRNIQLGLEKLGWIFTAVIHPSAEISPFATVACDAQLLARSVVQAYASIGTGCIVNTSGIVEHHTILGAWTHAAPGSVICGDAQLGEGCHIGAGAVVLQGILLGANTIVGGGACVTKNFRGNGTLVGVPARTMEN